jgi:regulatory helix-turn-helix LysR family protein/GDSL-like lipase/acylhydrolase family protein
MKRIGPTVHITPRLHQVRYFLAVCETLNFTRSAENCNVSQPALTRAVHKLEEELGGLPYRLIWQTVGRQIAWINNQFYNGDSLTYGQNGSNPGITSATRLAGVLNALGPTWQGTNYGNPGHTITQMISELGSHVNGLYDSTKQNNYLIAQGGHNDIVQGADASTVISRIQSYCSTALAANPWKIIWSTEPPAADPGIYPYNLDSIRDTVNSYVRQHWQSLGIDILW